MNTAGTQLPPETAPDHNATKPPRSILDFASWAVFLATSIQLVFLKPYITLIPGERSNVFSSVLCAISLILVLISNRGRIKIKSFEVWISAVLAGIIVISGILSETPVSSLTRGFVIASSGLGGYWCARLLLSARKRQVFWLWFSLALLSCVLILATVGVMNTGKIYEYLDSHWHPVGARVLLLSFAPLALLAFKEFWAKLLGVAMLCLSYLVLLLAGRFAGMESVIMIPAGLCLVALCCLKIKPRLLAVLALGLFLSSAIIGNFLIINSKNLKNDHISVAYRIENIFFSWRIAKDNPLFGLGLWAPRDHYIKEYQVSYSHITHDKFSQWTKELRTSENQVLTFMVDLGFPFVLIYAGVVLVLLRKILWRALAGDFSSLYHPLALMLPLLAGLLHFQVLDGLFHPQISWFFHILMGLIAADAVQAQPQKEQLKSFGIRLGVFSLTLAAGIVVGIITTRYLA